jgi:DNA-directed RNA polymerase subunit beta'
MDQAEIPIDIAWKIFEPHVTRKLSMSGIQKDVAQDRIKNRDIAATNALHSVMKEIPIIVNRAPSLHKHNFTAHYAKTTSGSTMNLPAEIEPMHNMDYDGDQLGIHVPLGAAAIKDAKYKLLPSKQLFSAANNDALIASIDLDPFIGFYEGSMKKVKKR